MAASGGIQRWELTAGTWTNIYTLGTGVNGIGARSLTVDFSGARPGHLCGHGGNGDQSPHRHHGRRARGRAAVTLAIVPGERIVSRREIRARY